MSEVLFLPKEKEGQKERKEGWGRERERKKERKEERRKGGREEERTEGRRRNYVHIFYDFFKNSTEGPFSSMVHLAE